MTTQQLESNLRETAYEGIRLYPDVFFSNTNTFEKVENIETVIDDVAYGYWDLDGFKDAGMSLDRCRLICAEEVDSYIADNKQ